VSPRRVTDRALSVPCPHCEASAYERCMARLGWRTSIVHSARVRAWHAAIALQDAEQTEKDLEAAARQLPLEPLDTVTGSGYASHPWEHYRDEWHRAPEDPAPECQCPNLAGDCDGRHEPPPRHISFRCRVYSQAGRQHAPCGGTCDCGADMPCQCECHGK
jgi:hypothetical protein